MATARIKDCKPDSYVHSIYDINYYKLHQNGIRYAIFDVDCTILPFDDINVTEDDITLFRYIKLLGIESGLCSSNFESRVKPVAEALGVNYVSMVPKPFGSFEEISSMFDDNCQPFNTVYIGDSLYLDMMQAARCGVSKILVDMIKGCFNFKLYPNEVINSVMFTSLRKYGVEEKKYYRGYIER